MEEEKRRENLPEPESCKQNQPYKYILNESYGSE